jgi:16S rRNA (cytidine1402-2'-O)-methyltransferase
VTVGTLYIVGTPIGNLGDITFRAVETLRSAARIYAEDTRRTKALLSHLGLDGKRLLSFHSHSSDRVLGTALEILASGEDIALVTDAGMPGISDPGADLVRAARGAGSKVTVVPGPSAVSSAVAISGLVDGPFTFLGFLPRKGSKRADVVRFMLRTPWPTVLFESPHRLGETLEELLEHLGPRQVAICRELTKKFEEVRVIELSEIQAPDFPQEWLGELVLVVSGAGHAAPEPETIDSDARLKALLAGGLSLRDAAQALKRELLAQGEKVSRRDLYARAQALRGEPEGPASDPSEEDLPDEA